MKKIYCKYCGLELERGSCKCEQSSKHEKHLTAKKICDSCGKKIDADAVYCPYCGLPQDVDGNIKALQKELRGENAIDVLAINSKEIKQSSRLKYAIIASMLIIMMGVIVFATFILPFVKQKISDYRLKKELETAEAYDEPVLTPTESETIEATSEEVIIEETTIEESKKVENTINFAPQKDKELYISSIRQIDENVSRGDSNCYISYYFPTIVGVDEREVRNVNEVIGNSFIDFKNALVNMANSRSELPESIIFDEIEQRQLNKNRMIILTRGELVPRKGFTEKKKFRFVYDRKSRIIKMEDISE